MTNERKIIAYPDWVTFGSVALVCVPICLARLSWGGPTQPGPLMDALPWLTLAAWLWVTYQIFLVEISYDERGVNHVSPLIGHVRLAWSEIGRLHFYPAVDGLMLEAHDGRRLAFNLWRVGADGLVEKVLDRLNGSGPLSPKANRASEK